MMLIGLSLSLVRGGGQFAPPGFEWVTFNGVAVYFDGARVAAPLGGYA